MRIATWNVNGLRARIDYVLHWLEDRRPDVVGLQELKLTDDQYPHERLREAGYESVVHGQKAWNGVAVLSRHPVELVEAGLEGQADLGARMIVARTAGLVFASVYVPNGKAVDHADYPRKLAWLERLAGCWEARARGREPAVVCGDFNVCPRPIDSWNEEQLAGTIFHTEEERARIRELLVSGCTDLFRELHPERQAFSWWDYRGGAFPRGRGLRIDFLLGNAAIRGRLRAVEIDRDFRKKIGDLKPSDHAPVWADLDPGGASGSASIVSSKRRGE
jgi:exodeoxyribonuclease-3